MLRGSCRNVQRRGSSSDGSWIPFGACGWSNRPAGSPPCCICRLPTTQIGSGSGDERRLSFPFPPLALPFSRSLLALCSLVLRLHALPLLPLLFGDPLSFGSHGIREAQIALEDLDKDRHDTCLDRPLPHRDTTSNTEVNDALKSRGPLPHGLEILVVEWPGEGAIVLGHLSKYPDEPLQAAIFAQELADLAVVGN